MPRTAIPYARLAWRRGSGVRTPALYRPFAGRPACHRQMLTARHQPVGPALKGEAAVPRGAEHFDA